MKLISLFLLMVAAPAFAAKPPYTCAQLSDPSAEYHFAQPPASCAVTLEHGHWHYDATFQDGTSVSFDVMTPKQQRASAKRASSPAGPTVEDEMSRNR